jgi:hypothetical protein
MLMGTGKANPHVKKQTLQSVSSWRFSYLLSLPIVARDCFSENDTANMIALALRYDKRLMVHGLLFAMASLVANQ